MADPTSTTTARRPATGDLIATLIFSALTVVATLRVALMVLPGLAAEDGDEPMQDFRDATYFPIRELFRSGGMPYDPESMFAHWPVVQEFDLYLPAHLWLHAPLAIPGYQTGASLMLVVDAALIVLLAGWSWLWAGRTFGAGRLPWWIWPALSAVLLIGQVGKAQLYLGQVNPLVAVGTAGALGWRDRPRLAALCLALAWIKPQFALPLAVLLIARRQTWTAIAGTGLAAVASLPVVAVLVVRAGGIGGFLDVVRANIAYATATGYGAVDSPEAIRIDLAALASRVFSWSPPGWVEPLVLVAVLAIAAVVVRRADRSPTVLPGLTDLVTVLAVLICVVHQPGDVLAAVPAMVVTAVAWWRSRALPHTGVAGSPAARALVLVALLALLVPHLHLYGVDQAIRAFAGDRVAGLVDAFAVALAAVCAVAALALMSRTDQSARTQSAQASR